MKKAKNRSDQESRRRNPVVRFAALIILLFALSGLCAVADEAMFETGSSESARSGAVDLEARKKVTDVEKRLKAAESSLEVVESRLGRFVQPPTLTRNFERRMQEVERRLDAIERDLKKLDVLARDMKRMEDRLRRVENKK